MRADLQSLTDDDLAALTNRGTVKRARQEVEAGALTVTFEESDDGTLTARWSDDVTITLPAGKPLAQARCTCPAEPPCRHIVRSVMALTALTPGPSPHVPPSSGLTGRGEPEGSGVPPLPAQRAPGPEERRTSGEGLGVRAARALYDAGQLFELVRSARPTARCHSLGTVTRFLVPGDPNHTVCDCGQPAPCDHAWMALWAFEQLPAEVEAGLVDTRTTPYPVPDEALRELEALLETLVQFGLAGAPQAFWDRLQRVEKQARRAGLIWPAECLLELELLRDAYHARDAQFDTATLALLVGELSLRCTATRANNGTVPPLFIRGTAADKTLELASAKLVGLGAGGRVRREGVQLTAFLQDENTGQVVAVLRDSPKASVSKGVTFAELAAGRALLRGGKRSPGGVLSLGRAPLAVHPQSYQWEKLRAPVLAESVAEVQARLKTLPPTALRPRRLAESFHVLPLAQVVERGFDTVEQAVVARLTDAHGGEVLLRHPYHASNAAGSEALLTALATEKPCFVAGTFVRRKGQLWVEPTSVVVEGVEGRRLVLPWLDTGERSVGAQGITQSERQRVHRFFTVELPHQLGERLITGQEAQTELEARQTLELAHAAEALGLNRLPTLLKELAEGNQGVLRTLVELTVLAVDL